MPKRGEVWWVRLDPAEGSEIAKTRPCVILSADAINSRRRTVVVIPLSTSPNPYPPLLIPVSAGGRNAVAVIDQIRAISKGRLTERLGSLTVEEMDTLAQGVREILELG
jgi:mRNA interferase MazF